MAPLVSVIIPVYNGEKFLGEALDSIWQQSYRPLEVIVVDDGSVDGSASIAQMNDKVRYIYQTNQGPSGARNRGVGQANGDLLAFLDHDDLWMPDKLASQVAYLQANPETDYVFCHMRFFLAEGMSWPASVNREHAASDPACILPSALLVRREAFDRVGLFDKKYRYAEDVDWFFRAQEAGLKRYVLPEVLLHRRLGRENISLNNIQQTHDQLLRVMRSSLARRRKAGKAERKQGVRLRQ